MNKTQINDEQLAIYMRFFFVTDIHGSEMCFRKFLNALKIYRIDVGMILGDLRGKVLVPIIREDNDTFSSDFLGHRTTMKTEQELQDHEKKIGIVGYYPYITTRAEVEELKKNPQYMDQVFLKLISQRLESWFKLAEERLADGQATVFIAPGNDDPLEIDKVLDRSKLIRSIGDRNIELDEHEIICCSYANRTPWNTPRECDEDELSAKIDQLATQVKNFEKAIFLLHVPPVETILDVAPKLSADLVPSVSETIHAGSAAVHEAIKKYQPLLSVHGHIHESRAIIQIGRTVCVNPGSEYSQGILRGAIVETSKGQIKMKMLTSG